MRYFRVVSSCKLTNGEKRWRRERERGGRRRGGGGLHREMIVGRKVKGRKEG